MKNTKHKLLLAFALIFTINFAFSQSQNIDSLQLIIPKGLETFTKKITIQTFDAYYFEDSITLHHIYPYYSIQDRNQDALFSSKNGLLSGTVTTNESFKKGEHKEGEKFRTEYKFEKSLVTEYTMFADDKLFVKAYRKDNQVFAKEFYKDGKISKEIQASLKPDKSCGLSITKSYDKDGNLYQIDDEITETHTQFYPNGKKKSVMGKTTTTYYDENEVITRKANFKIKPFYDDEFINGKLHSRSYKSEENEEVKEFFKNGIKEKKEITKIINGEKITFVYDKSGKLIDKHPFQIENQTKTASTSEQKPVATAVENPTPPTEDLKMAEPEIIPANFSGGYKVYNEFIINKLDKSKLDENEGIFKIILLLTIDTNGTVSLENHQQKIYGDLYLLKEMNRVLKISPKWNPAMQNGIPVKSFVEFPLTINFN